MTTAAGWLHAAGHWYPPHVNLFTSLFTRPTTRTAGPAAQKEALSFLFSMLLSISLVIAHTHIHTHACVEDFFTRLIWPHNVPTRESPFLVSLFVGRRPPFRVVVFRELQGCGTRPCPLLHHQQSFLPSALRLRRARRREICCSSLQKFTRTRTWVSMCVKKKQPLLLSNNGPHISSPNV